MCKNINNKIIEKYLPVLFPRMVHNTTVSNSAILMFVNNIFRQNRNTFNAYTNY